ncbi:MAG: ABC transporter permease [Actinobacteria bacterium]|nr:ABC transporter permease [Actinomycetota bacterium]
MARRNLFQERVRLLVSTAGVAFALLLVLALDGVVEGSLAQIAAYIDHSRADVWVSQPGVRSMHMSASALPLDKASEVGRVDGVQSVTPVLYTTNPVVAGARRSLAYVVGYDPDIGRGGPWKMARGDARLQRGEAVLDRQAAGKLGVSVGDQIVVLGAPFRVRGLSSGTSTITNSFVFVCFDDFATLRRLPDTASFLLVELQKGLSPSVGAQRIAAAVPGVQAATRTEFAREEGKVVRDMSAQIMVVMNAAGFSIGLAAVALTIYTAVLAKSREYGVLKALGARRRWLFRLVFAQAFYVVALGAAAAIVSAYALSQIFAWLLPGIPLRVVPASLLKVVAGGVVISLLAAGAPLMRIARLDPAAVFRR